MGKQALLFPELGRSYKQVFLLQMFACTILVFVLGYNLGVMWGAVAFAVSTLKDCWVLYTGVQQQKHDYISRATQDQLERQRAAFPATEGRLLSREAMDLPPAPNFRPNDTMPLGPEDYGK